MWQEADDLLVSGMQWGGAKAQAMADWLMLGPEDDNEDEDVEEEPFFWVP